MLTDKDKIKRLQELDFLFIRTKSKKRRRKFYRKAQILTKEINFNQINKMSEQDVNNLIAELEDRNFDSVKFRVFATEFRQNLVWVAIELTDLKESNQADLYVDDWRVYQARPVERGLEILFDYVGGTK